MLTTQAQRDASKRWREKHLDRARAGYERQKAETRERYHVDFEFREKLKAANRAAYARNPKASIESHHRWRQQPKNKMADRLRGRLRRAFKYGLTSSIEELLGCTLEQFRMHIMLQFSDGMTRGNHGELWEFDHIKPCSKFDLTDPAQQKLCFHFSNIRPLLKWENQSKKDSSVDQGHAHRQVDSPAQDHWRANPVTTIDTGQNHVRPEPPA